MAPFFLILVFFLFLDSLAFAAVSQVAPAIQFSSANYFWILFRTTISLLVVLGLIYFLARFFLKKPGGLLGGADFFIYRRLPLEPQVCLYLVKVGPKIMVLGVGGKRIALLESFPEETFPLEKLPAAGEPTKFSEILTRLTGKAKEKKIFNDEAE
jgi:flagellar biogenesis protein FliO